MTLVWKNLPFLLTPPLLWAGNIIVARAVRSDIPPLSLAFGRWLIALLVLLPFVWRSVRQDWPLYRQHKVPVILTALTGIAAFNTLVYTGLHSTTGTNALLLNSCIPVLIMLLSGVLYRRPLGTAQWTGLLLSLSGVAVIILRGSWQNLLSLQINRGDIWVFAAVVCWAFYTLWMKQMPSEIRRGGLMAVQILIGLAALLPLLAWEIVYGPDVEWNTQTAAALAYVGLFPSLLAYWCYTAAIARFGAVRAGLSIHLIPVFGTLLAVAFLGETVHAYHLLGIVAVFLGIRLGSRHTEQAGQ